MSMERNYTPKERLGFYQFITARNEWSTLRDLAKQLGWDRNKIRQLNRIRAYWENKPVAQKRQGIRTEYMDELINEYFKKVAKIDPNIVILDGFTGEAEYRTTTQDWEDLIAYGEGTLFIYDEEEGYYTSTFAEININEEDIDIFVGDSGPAKKPKEEE